MRGRAGVGAPGHHDVVLLIDRSVSTFASSGVDVNGNDRVGHDVGNRLHPVLWTSDFGDTIISAQLAAARRLIERLDPEITRMGLVTFGGTARLRAPVGAPRSELLGALDALGNAPKGDGTYIYGAVITAIEALEAAAAQPGAGTTRSIILLSDGVPTAPSPPSAARGAALRSAQLAAKAGITLYAYALGPNAARRRGLFEKMTRATGGELVVLDRPGDVIHFVPHLSLSHVTALRIDNLSMSEPARAVRLFPDGSFDGFAPLRPGRNLLRITATTDAGTERNLERVVHFEKTSAEGEAARAQIRQLRKTLEIRTVETELAERARRERRRAKERSLEIRVEGD